MNDWVSKTDLDEAIAKVTDDIRDTEEKLRREFTSTVRFEIGRVDKHLEDQDEKLDWIHRFAFASLVSVIGALIYLVQH